MTSLCKYFRYSQSLFLFFLNGVISLIDLFRLYVMFTHFKSRDNTLENHVFHFSWLPAYLSDAIEQVQ